MPSLEAVTAIVLAGGRSRRMGRDKGLLELGGLPLIHIVTERLLAVAGHLIIAGDDARRYEPWVRASAATFVPDVAGLTGPLAGVLAGADAAETEFCLLSGVDNPLVPAAFSQLLLGALGEREGAVAVLDGVPQVALGAFRTKTAAALTRDPASWPHGSIRALFARLDTVHVPEDQVRAALCPAGALMNINTPEEYERAVALYAASADGRSERESLSKVTTVPS